MSKITSEIIKIITAGGNVIVDCSDKIENDLIEIVSTATNCNKKVILKNAESKTTDTLIKVISCGGDNVFVEV